MSLGLPFRLRSYMCCGLTTAPMSLPIYQLNRAYCPSTQKEFTNHSLKE
ncbi:hypothetical protein F383_32463 [Gossypium arboreum]|uniref:Uncharacterized protein n=1 Tax=Gossypium arboreum TaxID=29729 RepID=A0A0B0NWI9_GOSAR|nr:hypothetical protein F383_25467 [Gossypium arboreum]KHG25706.1 hypothetical protein F383_32463 [Gossypium arboreum]